MVGVIKSFRHAGLEEFYRTGSRRGINPAHEKKLAHQLGALKRAIRPSDMNLPGWRLHPLTGHLRDHWSVRVSGKWRLTFMFEGEDVILVDYQDYH